MLRIEDLIPLAEQYAYEACGKSPKQSAGPAGWYEWSKHWDRVFHRRMDEMAHKEGLRTLAWQIQNEI